VLLATYRNDMITEIKRAYAAFDTMCVRIQDRVRTTPRAASSGPSKHLIHAPAFGLAKEQQKIRHAYSLNYEMVTFS